MLRKLSYEAIKVIPDCRLDYIKFTEQSRNNRLEATMLFKKRPHSRTNLIETKVRSCFHIERYGLAFKHAKDDVLRNLDNRI